MLPVVVSFSAKLQPFSEIACNNQISVPVGVCDTLAPPARAALTTVPVVWIGKPLANVLEVSTAFDSIMTPCQNGIDATSAKVRLVAV